MRWARGVAHPCCRLGLRVAPLVRAYRFQRLAEIGDRWARRELALAIEGVEQLAVLDDSLEVRSGQLVRRRRELVEVDRAHRGGKIAAMIGEDRSPCIGVW